MNDAGPVPLKFGTPSGKLSISSPCQCTPVYSSIVFFTSSRTGCPPDSDYAFLEAPVLRVGAFDTPYPPSRIEEEYLPDLDRVLDAVDRSFSY